ncbi:uncharacterized protein JCM15063_000696 [Sporobolomyces koalae]|uniref:uncharacterized protein n=1 Tax=Sporobolomyces koalae TaxID=500713 RepID=UPI00317E74E8
MLNHLLANRYACSSPPLIVLSDSLAQPGLSLFHQIVSSAPTSTNTILICLEQSPVQNWSFELEQGKLQVIDCTCDDDFPQPVASTSASHVTAAIDLADAQAHKTLGDAVVNAVHRAKPAGGPVQVAIDGINALADQSDVNVVWRLLKRTLKALEGLPTGSRLVLVHHDHFPSRPFAVSSPASPALLPSLLSPLLSSSTIHLTLHPTAQFHTLSIRYSLVLPSILSPHDDPDLRTTEFLTRLRERGVGDPFRRPERSDEEDERIALDNLGNGDGKAVLGWNCRGVAVGKVSRVGASNGPASGSQEKKVVTSGFEGVRRIHDNSSQVEEVVLGAVLDPRKSGRRQEDALDSPALASSHASAPARPTVPASTGSSTAPTALPFSLSLTPSQLAARSLVSNPYEGHNQPIFGEAGYTGQMDDQAGRNSGGLKVEYTADRGDDLDEEEPDEDLEI